MSAPWDHSDDPDELGLAGGLGPHFPGDVRLPGEAGEGDDGEDDFDPVTWTSTGADGPGLPAPGRHGGLRPGGRDEPGDDPVNDVGAALDGLSSRLAAARTLIADRHTPGEERPGPVGAVPEPGGGEGSGGGGDGPGPPGPGGLVDGPAKSRGGRVAKSAGRSKPAPQRDDGDGGPRPLGLGPEPVDEKPMGRPGYPVDDLVRFLKDRPASSVEPAATGFREATFSAIFKSAGLRSTGAWRVVLEVPSAEAEAFFPVRKAFELELTCTVRRKSTQGPGKEGASEEAARQEGGGPKSSRPTRPSRSRRTTPA